MTLGNGAAEGGAQAKGYLTPPDFIPDDETINVHMIRHIEWVCMVHLHGGGVSKG